MTIFSSWQLSISYNEENKKNHMINTTETDFKECITVKNQFCIACVIICLIIIIIKTFLIAGTY